MPRYIEEPAVKMPRLFETRLVQIGLATPAQILDAIEIAAAERPPLGRLAVARGLMSMRSVFRVLEAQATSGLRFGEQAVALGCLREADLFGLLRAQYDMRADVVSALVRQGIASREVLEAARSEFRRDSIEADVELPRMV